MDAETIHDQVRKRFAPVAADQNGDGAVDPLDSGFVLARFGPCP